MLEGAEYSEVLLVFVDTALSGAELVFSGEVFVGYEVLEGLEVLEVREGLEVLKLLELLAVFEGVVSELRELTEVLELVELTFEGLSFLVVIEDELLAVTGVLVRTSLDFEDRGELNSLTFALVV